MDPFTFMMNVLDPVDLSRWPTRSQAMMDLAHHHMRQLLEGKFVIDYKLPSGSLEFEAQKYFVRMVRRIISDLERKFCPRVRAMAAAGESNMDIMNRIIKGLELDSTGNILMHLLYEEFFPQYMERAKKIDYKDPQTMANDMFVKALAGSFEQAALVLKTECAKAGIEIHNL
jgi:hypothetical protein